MIINFHYSVSFTFSWFDGVHYNVIYQIVSYSKHSPLIIHEITPQCWILCIFIFVMKINSMHMDFSRTKLSSRPKTDNQCPDSVSSLLWRSHWNISFMLRNIETLIWICLEKIESEKTTKNCFNRSTAFKCT